MSLRRSSRLKGEDSINISNSTILDEPPIKIRKINKESPTSITEIARDIPGIEYVSNVNIDDCESDSDGLKGEVFAQYVYKKLKHINSDSTDEIPQIFIMMGPPGAGKSTIKRQFDIKNYVNIDLDEIKKILQKCFPNDRSIQGFGIIHQLKRLAKYLLETAIRENINILFDTTGRIKDLVTDVIYQTLQANYNLCLIIISTSRENCLQRAQMRNMSELDREPMTSDMVNGAYDSFMEKSADKGTLSYYLITNSEFISQINEIYIFDNNGSSPELLFKRIGENIETVVDYPDFYNMRINSSPPYFSLKRRGGRRTKRRKNNRKKTKRHK